MNNFNIGDSLGSRSDNDIASYLRLIGDADGARALLSGNAGGQAGLLGARRAFMQTGVILGYISPENGARIRSVSEIEADQALIDQSIKITLDKFYVHSYPGLGEHTIVCEFQGNNQIPGEGEELTFAFNLKARDRSAAGVAGAPIFVGLNVGRDGISFKGRTINVRSSGDEILLDALASPVFKSGLSLLHTVQPALKPLTSLAVATANTLAKRSSNTQVHTFDLGLDFDGSASSARLRRGTYVVVQSDEASWDWSAYQWNRASLSLTRKLDGQSVENNYMVVGVSEYSQQPLPAA